MVSASTRIAAAIAPRAFAVLGVTLLVSTAMAAPKEPSMPTPALESALGRARSAGVERSEPLARGLVHVAEHAPADRAGALLQAAVEADPSLPAPHLALARRALQRFDLIEAVSELGAAVHVARLDARQEAAMSRAIVRGAHAWIWFTFAALAVLFGLRAVPLARHALGERLGSRTAATLLLGVPIAIAYVASVTIGVLATAVAATPFMRRRERVCLVALCALTGAFELALPAFAPQALLLDPRTRPAQLARLGSGAQDLELENRWATRRDLDADQQLVLGLQARRRGDFDTAAKRYVAALRSDSTCVAAYVNLANLFFRHGQYERAITGYRTAATHDPTAPVPHHNLAQTYIRTTHYAESDAELKAAAALGMATAGTHRSLWHDESVPVLDLSLTKADLVRIARDEAARVEGGPRRSILLAWKCTPWRSVHPGIAPWLLLAVVIVLLVEPRLRTATTLCSSCGTVVCRHCTSAEPTENLCNTCLLARPRTGPRPIGPEGERVAPRRRISIASGRWIAPFFPGAADLAREAPIVATLTVATAVGGLLVARALVIAAREAGASTGADAMLLRLALVVVGGLWLPGLLRLRQGDSKPRPLARPQSMGA